MKRNYCLSLYLCFFALLFSCTSDIEEKRPALRVGVLYTPDTLPLHVAKEYGFFDEEGVDVELIPFTGHVERNSAFSSGQIDGMNSDLINSLIMRDKGLDAKVVWLTVGDRPGQGRMALLVAPGSKVQSAVGLRGKTVAMSAGSIVEFVADQLLAEQGVDESEYSKTVLSSIPTRMTMLIEGKVDAAVLPDPLAAHAESQGCRVLLDDTHEAYSQAVLTFHEESLRRHPEEMRRFSRALQRAVEAINSDRLAFEQMLADITRTPKGDKPIVITYPVAKLPTQEQASRVHRWLVEKGKVTGGHEYASLVTDAFLP